MILNGLSKSSILLMLIGAEDAIKVFKYLKKSEIKNIISSTMDINLVSQTDLNIICNDFMLQYKKISQSIVLDKESYIRKIEKNFFNKNKLEDFLKRISNKKNFFDKIQELHNIPDKNLFDLLRYEHTYIITSILFFLDSKYAASVIAHFKYKQQAEIILLIANFSGLDELKLLRLVQVIDVILSEYKNLSRKRNNLITATSILNTIGFEKSRKIMHDIFKYDEVLGTEILYLTFSFDDFVRFTNHSIMKLIQYVNHDQIAIALYHTKKEIKYKFFQCCKHIEKNVNILETDKTKDISYSIVKDAQELLVLTAKKLLKKKKISIVY